MNTLTKILTFISVLGGLVIIFILGAVWAKSYYFNLIDKETVKYQSECRKWVDKKQIDSAKYYLNKSETLVDALIKIHSNP